MAQPSVHYGDQHFAGAVTFGSSVSLAAGSVADAQVSASAAIAATKIVHQFPLTHQQATGSAVADQTVQLHMANGAGTLVALKASVDTAAVGDSTVTVDLQKSTAGGAFATVLTAVVTVNSSTVVRTVSSGTFASTSYVAGDIFRLVIDATAGTGTLPQGLCVTAFVREAAQ